MPGVEDGPVRLRRRGHREQRYGLSHRPAGAGQSTGVRRRARRASARQGAAGRRPTVGELPQLSCPGPGGTAIGQSRDLPDEDALTAARSGLAAGRLARRRRALEDSEENPHRAENDAMCWPLDA